MVYSKPVALNDYLPVYCNTYFTVFHWRYFISTLLSCTMSPPLTNPPVLQQVAAVPPPRPLPRPRPRGRPGPWAGAGVRPRPPPRGVHHQAAGRHRHPPRPQPRDLLQAGLPPGEQQCQGRFFRHYSQFTGAIISVTESSNTPEVMSRV